MIYPNTPSIFNMDLIDLVHVDDLMKATEELRDEFKKEEEIAAAPKPVVEEEPPPLPVAAIPEPTFPYQNAMVEEISLDVWIHFIYANLDLISIFRMKGISRWFREIEIGGRLDQIVLDKVGTCTTPIYKLFPLLKKAMTRKGENENTRLRKAFASMALQIPSSSGVEVLPKCFNLNWPLGGLVKKLMIHAQVDLLGVCRLQHNHGDKTFITIPMHRFLPCTNMAVSCLGVETVRRAIVEGFIDFSGCDAGLTSAIKASMDVKYEKGILDHKRIIDISLCMDPLMKGKLTFYYAIPGSQAKYYHPNVTGEIVALLCILFDTHWSYQCGLKKLMEFEGIFANCDPDVLAFINSTLEEAERTYAADTRLELKEHPLLNWFQDSCRLSKATLCRRIVKRTLATALHSCIHAIREAFFHNTSFEEEEYFMVRQNKDGTYTKAKRKAENTEPLRVVKRKKNIKQRTKAKFIDDENDLYIYLLNKWNKLMDIYILDFGNPNRDDPRGLYKLVSMVGYLAKSKVEARVRVEWRTIYGREPANIESRENDTHVPAKLIGTGSGNRVHSFMEGRSRAEARQDKLLNPEDCMFHTHSQYAASPNNRCNELLQHLFQELKKATAQRNSRPIDRQYDNNTVYICNSGGNPNQAFFSDLLSGNPIALSCLKEDIRMFVGFAEKADHVIAPDPLHVWTTQPNPLKLAKGEITTFDPVPYLLDERYQCVKLDWSKRSYNADAFLSSAIFAFEDDNTGYLMSIADVYEQHGLEHKMKTQPIAKSNLHGLYLMLPWSLHGDYNETDRYDPIVACASHVKALEQRTSYYPKHCKEHSHHVHGGMHL